jgi:hypothetical protein
VESTLPGRGGDSALILKREAFRKISMISTGAVAKADSTMRAQQTAWKRAVAVCDELRQITRAVRQATRSTPASAWARPFDRGFSIAGGRWPRFAPLAFAVDGNELDWTEITPVDDTRFQLRCLVGGAQITQHPHHGLP